jgi:phosphoglycerate dehydrogenase-like enzyme
VATSEPLSVVFHYAAGPALTARLASLEGLTVSACAEDDDARFHRLLRDADVLWHVLRPITAQDIDAAPRLRLIQKIGIGVNTIDLAAASKRGIAVCNLPGTNSRAVAELTLALMLAALRRLPAMDTAIRHGRGWTASGSLQEQAGELGGRTVGLVGYGAVARLLAPVLVALGARVRYAARSEHPEAPGERRELDELLAESDVVSLHLPLTPETERLLDARSLGRMKRGAVLVNTSRGGLVDEAALVDALRSGRLRAAGLDVFEHEPLPADNPLLGLENVVLAPHVAWLTPETLERSVAVAAENCRRLAAGEPLLHRVA